MAELFFKKYILWYLELYFFSWKKYSAKVIFEGNSSWSVIRRKETEDFKIIKKYKVVAQVSKNIYLQAALKDF